VPTGLRPSGLPRQTRMCGGKLAMNAVGKAFRGFGRDSQCWRDMSLVGKSLSETSDVMAIQVDRSGAVDGVL
jgi:hypothetical protein